MNFSTGAFEMAHKANSKIPGRRVNWHDSWYQQLLNHVTRHECIDEIAPDPTKEPPPRPTTLGYMPSGDMAHKKVYDYRAILEQCCPTRPTPVSADDFLEKIAFCLKGDNPMALQFDVCEDKMKELKKAIINVNCTRQDVVRAGHSIAVAAGDDTWYAKVVSFYDSFGYAFVAPPYVQSCGH